ncbi:MAG: leucyl aminopeptidase [Candidatus Latescibacteria bacterium]|nr:leucyl aminopeptidase [Candidatus Latescibacterota bacterium]NIO01020.1 leucyl aminopeptidase [Candidatus Latescibacterota bacterium]NIO27419.1 leucyl aminopeptidase [Candidatus Latescibacterota bacterium]NIO54941.1 leucyl aminopeptidase [Candidatus Latescibacterota bacterium]NIT01030.1 leucyl aminopeptidase [Candidatus Latescibacterota bacterium]
MITKISFTGPDVSGREEAVIVPLFKGTRALKGAVRKLDAICNSAITGYLDRGNFDGSGGKTLLVALSAPGAPRHILLLGLGEREKLDPEKTAHYAGTASLALKNNKIKTAHLILDGTPGGAAKEDFVFSFLKGFLLAQYTFSLKEEPEEETASVETLHLMCGKERSRLSRVAARARIVTDRTAKVRDMVNAPPNALTPAKMALEAKAISKETGIECRVMNLKELQRRKMGAITSVAKGSKEEPNLIVMQYNRDRERLPLVCLVGKGVTFDSGGISLKSWEKMSEMKGDMAGGALVINVLAAAAELKLPLRLTGIVPCAENLPGGSAYKPGDIVRTFAGKTVEVISTDAEGRLVLSDALAYAKEFNPHVIVDFATLTGACVIALGTRIAGVIGTSQEHVDAFLQAGKATGEPVWQLPLNGNFREMVKGDITDFKNFSGREASTITAAALLSEFVGDIPWVHLDIAGPFWNEGGKVSYQTKGATGYGVDLTIHYLEKMASRRRGR